jgi:hypothetical protein
LIDPPSLRTVLLIKQRLAKPMRLQQIHQQLTLHRHQPHLPRRSNLKILVSCMVKVLAFGRGFYLK